ncbi:hypothetical protein ABNB59_15500 [Paenibacillus larvae]|uniref:Phage protein n=1 Tax=Paenibacillus larvae TaxID=1464 RepID=A0AAP5JPU0_9BACL|nr:hypothetical protein [Paenibacillus larvae]AQR76380.1 hypothetical protein BXP28_02260 [Paenibacillus larvae subsp. larvae]AVF22809.1 hypothetical protein ERICI_02999 [Paenibacillus larvae subsp. larvae]ETK26534.1 hypothetical protein ERIC1_2c07560 [Paenibacillus larvae subsp. larvae DSM 25719]MCY7476051.1 hypothetical protein [Paenibacillus larvae]MCY7490117.1 hypothetical protein [Paenibacillus larvae]
MKFSPLFLYAYVETGKDRLGNPIKEKKLIRKSSGRLSNWTAEDIAADVRNLTKTTRKIVTRAPLEDCKKSELVALEGTEYKIVEPKNYGRWRLLIVKAYGT